MSLALISLAPLIAALINHPCYLIHPLIQCCLFQDPNGLNPDGAEAAKLIIASLMQTYPHPKILKFLKGVVKGIDAAVLVPQPPVDEKEPSSVILEEIEAPEQAAKGPLHRPCPPREQSEDSETQGTAPKADTEAVPAPTDGVGAAWSVEEKALHEARSLYKSSRAAEDTALASLEAFLQCYGEASKWIQMAQGRRQEIAAATAARSARERRCNLEKIEETRLARTRAIMEEARRARERAKRVARRAREETQRRLQEEERLQRELAGEQPAQAGARAQALPRYYMCGKPGVKKPRNCPNLARHKGRWTR